MRYISFILVFISINALSQNSTRTDSLKNKLNKYISFQDSVKIFDIYYSLGKQYYKTENNILSLTYYQKSLLYSKKEQQPKVYNRLASTYWRKGDYESAMKHYRKSLNISEEIGDKKLQATALNNIGFIYAEYNQPKKTLEYYLLSLEIRKEINDQKGIAHSYNSLGRVYLSIDSINIALDYVNKSIEKFRSINYQIGESNALNSLGNIYMAKQEPMLALKYYKQSLEIRMNKNYLHLIAESYKNIAKVYIKNNDYKNAEVVINKGIIISKEIESKKLLKSFYYQLYELNKKNRNYEKALSNYLNFSVIQDSLLSKDSKNKIAELEVQYQLDKKEQKIKLLSFKDKLNTQKIKKQRTQLTFFILGALIFLISFVVVFLIYIQKNKAYKMLVKQNVEITKLEQLKEDKQNIQNIFEKNNSKNEQIKHKVSKENEILDKLKMILIQNKYFLNPNCNLENLSKEINTNRQYLSQIINENYKINFNNFINSHRIKESRKLLLDKNNDKYTIEAIGKLSGFKTRASFNSAFKKFTGVTPSFFKKNN